MTDTTGSTEALKAGILELVRGVDEEAVCLAPRIEAVLPRHRVSALNLAH